GVVGHAALEGDRFKLGASRRLARAARVTPFAMLDHLGGPLERAHLADAGDVAAIPFHAELEILVRIEPLRIDAELSHGALREQPRAKTAATASQNRSDCRRRPRSGAR